MRRIHWFEIHDCSWCPARWRVYLQDILSFFSQAFRPYDVIVGRLGEAVIRSGAERIVDLCSGAGAPAVTVQRALHARGLSIPLILTDKYPHPIAGGEVVGSGDLEVIEKPVDAMAVPPDLKGFRTLFTAFHHFTPAQARGILADAAEQRQGIGVFEYTERNWFVWGPALLLTPLVVWIVTPFLRPLSLNRWFWTYLVPIVPLMGVWDGLVSCLRAYSPGELQAMTASLDQADYRWEVGQVRAFGGCRITYLLGWPEKVA